MPSSVQNFHHQDCLSHHDRKNQQALPLPQKTVHPGNARGRNTHLFALLKAPHGTESVRLWAEAWVSGSVPQKAVDIWTKGVVKPLGKKAGEGVRPITMFATLLKVATGLALDVSKRHDPRSGRFPFWHPHGCWSRQDDLKPSLTRFRQI